MLERLNEIFPGKEYLSKSEAAKVLGIAPRTLERLIIKKQIRAIDTNAGGTNRHYIIAKTEIARCGT